MGNVDFKVNYLFRNEERNLFEKNNMNKYKDFFFFKEESKNKNINYGGRNSKNLKVEEYANEAELVNEEGFNKFVNVNKFTTNHSIFSLETEYSSKMKKKMNKNMVKNT